MKVAVCGSGPLAIEMTHRLDQLGAEVYLFSKPHHQHGIGGKLRQIAHSCPEMMMEGPYQEISSHWGRNIVGNQSPFDTHPTVGEYVANYLEPLIASLYKKQLVKNGKVLRVHKRFLSKNEVPKSYSRLIDLFRVVYESEPTKEQEENILMNKQGLNDLDENLLPELMKGLERCQDFDLVVDATGTFNNPLPMGAAGHLALNEQKLRNSPNIFYGYEGIVYKEKQKDKKDIIIVGSGLTAARTLLSYKDRLKSGTRITVVTSEGKPFERLFSENKDPAVLSKLSEFFNGQQEEFGKKIKKFEADISEWRGFEKHVQLKIPKPQEPTPNFDIIFGANITSIDKFLDREGLFITLETPEFREEKVSFDIKTLGPDLILVCTGFKKMTDLDGTQFSDREPGFFNIGLNEFDESLNLKEGILKIDLVVKQILEIFTPADKDSSKLDLGNDYKSDSAIH